MAPWRMWIGSIAFEYSPLGRNLYLFEEFNRTLYFDPCLSYALGLLSFGFDFCIPPLFGIDLSIVLPKQISDMLAVYFEGRHFNGHVFIVLFFVSFNFILDENRNSWQNSWNFIELLGLSIVQAISVGTFHCVSLSWACLAICENASVLSI